MWPSDMTWDARWIPGVIVATRSEGGTIDPFPYARPPAPDYFHARHLPCPWALSVKRPPAEVVPSNYHHFSSAVLVIVEPYA